MPARETSRDRPASPQGDPPLRPSDTRLAERDYLTIVSGLPRSGTSLMMEMLQAGGLPLMVDEVRRADEDNLRGYFEFEPVKKTREDPSWLREAPGAAVKMVYRLLRDLPHDYRYRVIFLRRRLAEIHASQEAMLRRNRKQSAFMEFTEFERIFTGEIERILQWVASQPNFAILQVDYNALMEDPRPRVTAIDAFLDGGLDVDAMCGIVTPSLYRQRA
jgi:hypothetical protein